jgi:DamX protein
MAEDTGETMEMATVAEAKSPSKRQLAERIDALADQAAQLERQTAALGADLQRLHGAQNGLSEIMGRLAGQVERLAGKGDELEVTLHRTLREGGAGVGPDQDALVGLARTTDLEGLWARLDALDSREGGGGQQDLTALRQGIAALETTLEDSRRHTADLEARLASLSLAEGPITRLEEQIAAGRADLERLAQRLALLETEADQDTALVVLEDRLVQLEMGLGSAGNAVQDALSGVATRLDGMESDLQALQDRYAALAEADGRLGASLEALRGQAVTPQAADEKAAGEARLNALEQGLEATRAQVEELGSALDTSTAEAAAVRQRDQARDQRIGAQASALRVLGWGGVVAILLVVALSVAGYLLSDQKRHAQQVTLEGQLQRLDQRIAAAAGVDPQAAARVQAQLNDLQRQLEQAGQREGVASLEAQEVNMTQALDDLGRRVVGLEERMAGEAPPPTGSSVAAPPAASPGPAPPSPQEAHVSHSSTSGAAPATVQRSEGRSEMDARPDGAAIKPVAHRAGRPQARHGRAPRTVARSAAPPPAPPSDQTGAVDLAQWQQAQDKGRFTLQLTALTKRAELAGFVRRHGLQGQVVWTRSESKGRTWYVLLHGIYPDSARAGEAARALRAKHRGVNAWVRRIPREAQIQVLP